MELNGKVVIHDPRKVAADPAPPVPAPAWYQTYLTHVGLVLGLAGLLSTRLGLHLSDADVNGLITWIAANWDVLTGLAGGVVALISHGHACHALRRQAIELELTLSAYKAALAHADESLGKLSHP